MVLTKSPLKKHKVSEVPNLKDVGPALNEHRKTNIVKKTKGPDKVTNKPKDTKAKPSNNKQAKVLKSASVTKKIVEQSKIPVPLSKSSTYKQITVQPHKKTIPRKKIASPRSSKEQPSNSAPSNKADLKYVMLPKDKSFMKLDKIYQSDVASRVKQLKKHEAENLKRIKNQYFSSVLSDIRKSDFEATLRKYADDNKNVPTELKKKKKKSIKKKTPPKIIHISPHILSDNNENEYGSINSLRKDSPSLTTQFLDIDSQTSQIPITKKFKTVKPKKSPREKLTTDGKDVKSTQLTQHKKKSKTHTLKQNHVQSSDSVPNLPIREIKHNDSFVLSAKKFNSSMKRASARHKKSPVHLKLKTKRPKSVKAMKTAEVKNDSTKPEKLKSCLKKTWEENNFTAAVQNKYEMNFGLVPLIVN